MPNRIYAFDTAKFALITLVVVGHFLETFILGEYSATSRFVGVFIWIYSFHMPLFIFISGLFLRSFPKDAAFPARRVMMLVMLGFALKAVKVIFFWFQYAHETGFQLLGEGGPAWFFFALAAFVAFAWLLREFKSVPVLLLAIGIGIAVGYDSSIGDYLYLSRIAVFFPFFWLGYALEPSRVLALTNKLWVRISAVIVLLGFAWLSIVHTDQIVLIRYLFTGRNSYENIGIVEYGWVIRLGVYAISALMCVAVIAITPRREIPVITAFGSRSLQIFFWHFVVINLVATTGIAERLQVATAAWPFVLVAIAVASSFVLAYKPLGAPLTWLTTTRQQSPLQH